jgi:YbbR domain-containing protein
MAFLGLRHLGLKFLSIALAALLWLLVSGERIVERAMRIPLEFTNLPAHLEIVGDTPDVVDVRLRGSSGALSRVATGELVAMLDLRTARTGRRLFHLTGGDVRTPFGLEVVQVTPANVSLVFEPSGTKIVPVVPAVEGDPADGYLVGTVTADPATVEVVGPVSALGSLTEAITEPISVSNASAPVLETVTIGVPDPAVRLREPQMARVNVNVTPAPVEWAVAAIPVTVRNNEQTNAQVTPGQVTVFVRGPRESMASGASEFEATVDVSGLRTGQYQVPVRVVPPARIGVLKVEPPQLQVRIR